jgi:hypothetical protein
MTRVPDRLSSSFPKVAGSVAVIVPDSTCGWYIGGDFTVSGKATFRPGPDSGRRIVTDWNPSVTGTVDYIAPPVVNSPGCPWEPGFL